MFSFIMTVEIVSDPQRAQWDAVFASVVVPAVNQTWEWGEAMRTIKGVQPIRLLATCDGKPSGVLQAFEWKIGPLSMAISSGESGDGGGPVVSGDVPAGKRKDIAVKLLEVLADEAKKRSTLKFTVYGSPEFGANLPAIGKLNIATKCTPVIELLSDPEQMLNEKVDQKARNQITKSEKNGVTVREGSRDELAAYRSIQHGLTEKKRLERTHLNSLSSLQHLWDALASKGMIKLWLAEKDGRVIGGALILYAGKGLLYRSGVLTEEGRDCYAGNALQWQIIADAIRRGYRTYNMCGGTTNESDSLYGITKFKMSFGGEMREFRRYSAGGNRILRFLAYRLRRMFGRNEWFPLLIYP